MNLSYVNAHRNAMINLFLPLLLAGIVCLAPGADSAAHAGNIFYCSYDTNLGQLNLVVEAGSEVVQGTYPAKTGSVAGRIDEGVFRGAWRQAKSKKSGYFYLVFDETGDRFKGKWAYKGDTNWRGDWTGKKIEWTQDEGNVNKSLEWFNRLEGRALGAGERQMTDVGPEDCAIACLRENGFKCRSFDYHKENRTCDLTSYQYPNASYIGSDPNVDMYERDQIPSSLWILTRTFYTPPDPATVTVKAVTGWRNGPKPVPISAGKAAAPRMDSPSAPASGKWYALAYSPKYHYWETVWNQPSKSAAEAAALKGCNAKTQNSGEVVGTGESGHISMVVSKKGVFCKRGDDDKQRAFDACYHRRGPCHLLVRVGPEGVVERNEVNFKKLKTSTSKQPANVSPKYKHLFANSEKDLWNSLISDLGSQIDKEAGNKIASTMLSLFKNAEKPKKTGRINLNMRFDSDCSAIRKQAEPMLNKLGNLLRKEKDIRILIRGHNSGKTNMIPLSLARARSVKAYLVKYHDIDPKRIKTEGMGNSEPLVREKTKAAALVNQRIDIEML